MLKNAVRMRTASLIISLVVVMSIGCMGTVQAKGFFSSILSALQPSTASTDGGTTGQISGETPYVFDDVEGIGKVQGFQKRGLAGGVVDVQTVSTIDGLPAKGVFKVIRVVTLYNGSDSFIFLLNSALTDDAGRKYNVDPTLMSRLSNVHSNVLQSSLTKGYTEVHFVAFDVPANANPKTLAINVSGNILQLPLTGVRDIDTSKPESSHVYSVGEYYNLVHSAFKNNPANFDLTVNGKMFLVKGQISSISQQPITNAYEIDLSGGAGPVSCFFDGSKTAAIAKLAVGQEISVCGNAGATQIGLVYLGNCKFL